MSDEQFLAEAVRLSERAVANGNEPFGAVLVRDGEIVYSNENQIYTQNDPTEHAEFGLIRRFCRETGITDLSSYTLYSSCEPCFMCSGSLVWTKLGRLVYAASNDDLAEILGEPGCECAAMVFTHSPFGPRVRSGLLREESRRILADYFSDHSKG